MYFRKQLITCASVVATLLAAGSAQAGARPFMSNGEIVAPPPGYADLCQREEALCGAPDMTVAQAPARLVTAALATSSIGVPQPAEAISTSTKVDASDPANQDLIVYRPAVAADFAPAGQALMLAANADIEADVRALTTVHAYAPAADVRSARLTKGQMRLVNEINREVNRDVHKASDFDLYGLLEYWSLPKVIDGKMYGDCEDYALEKRRRLIAAGIPADTISMAVAVTARGESHAVLVVAFESGDWVLDNLTPWATPWSELNYRWVQRQVEGSSQWATIS